MFKRSFKASMFTITGTVDTEVPEPEISEWSAVPFVDFRVKCRSIWEGQPVDIRPIVRIVGDWSQTFYEEAHKGTKVLLKGRFDSYRAKNKRLVIVDKRLHQYALVEPQEGDRPMSINEVLYMGMAGKDGVIQHSPRNDLSIMPLPIWYEEGHYDRKTNGWKNKQVYTMVYAHGAQAELHAPHVKKKMNVVVRGMLSWDNDKDEPRIVLPDSPECYMMYWEV